MVSHRNIEYIVPILTLPRMASLEFKGPLCVALSGFSLHTNGGEGAGSAGANASSIYRPLF
jgi:hypothetical protein